MSSRFDSSNSRPVELLSSRTLSVVALVLFVLFATVLLGVLFPFQPLDAAWQLRMAAALINGVPFPLVGLALLHLAHDLEPRDPRIQRRWRRCRELAVGASLGFLLLLPLQGVAGLKESRALNSAQSSQISGAEHKLADLRQAVARAGNNADLNQQLQRLQGPVLGPADMAQPLPLLKAQVNAVLDQAQIQIKRDRQAIPPEDPWRLLPDLFRNAFACLALAIGFAALAVRPGSEISLLQEWQGIWLRSRLQQVDRKRQSGKNRDNLAYLSQISGEE
jgi:hypothetical protein